MAAGMEDSFGDHDGGRALVVPEVTEGVTEASATPVPSLPAPLNQGGRRKRGGRSARRWR